ncbi:hypothetical protein PR048_015135 [Dryococelus australis]|uniref:Uncharacterized protein n=1 Tax=Dryococelus australis TaxID=614101 RepID=A0ABQ9HG28_9NEOP|nr:hypothetical protein PR048_015135 [Dryococelus australis]
MVDSIILRAYQQFPFAYWWRSFARSSFLNLTGQSPLGDFNTVASVIRVTWKPSNNEIACPCVQDNNVNKPMWRQLAPTPLQGCRNSDETFRPERRLFDQAKEMASPGAISRLLPCREPGSPHPPSNTRMFEARRRRGKTPSWPSMGLPTRLPGSRQPSTFTRDNRSDVACRFDDDAHRRAHMLQLNNVHVQSSSRNLYPGRNLVQNTVVTTHINGDFAPPGINNSFTDNNGGERNSFKRYYRLFTITHENAYLVSRELKTACYLHENNALQLVTGKGHYSHKELQEGNTYVVIIIRKLRSNIDEKCQRICNVSAVGHRKVPTPIRLFVYNSEKLMRAKSLAFWELPSRNSDRGIGMSQIPWPIRTPDHFSSMHVWELTGDRLLRSSTRVISVKLSHHVECAWNSMVLDDTHDFLKADKPSELQRRVGIQARRKIQPKQFIKHFSEAKVEIPSRLTNQLRISSVPGVLRDELSDKPGGCSSSTLYRNVQREEQEYGTLVPSAGVICRYEVRAPFRCLWPGLTALQGAVSLSTSNGAGCIPAIGPMFAGLASNCKTSMAHMWFATWHVPARQSGRGGGEAKHLLCSLPGNTSSRAESTVKARLDSPGVAGKTAGVCSQSPMNPNRSIKLELPPQRVGLRELQREGGRRRVNTCPLSCRMLGKNIFNLVHTNIFPVRESERALYIAIHGLIPRLLKAVHDNVGTFEINLRNKSLPLSAYIITDPLGDIRLVKYSQLNIRCIVAERLDCSPPIKVNRAHSEFSQVGIVPYDAAGHRVFSGISRFPHLCILALLHTEHHFALIGSKDLDVKKVQIA